MEMFKTQSVALDREVDGVSVVSVVKSTNRDVKKRLSARLRQPFGSSSILPEDVEALIRKTYIGGNRE